MTPAERRRAILDLLETQGEKTVEELARYFGVSQVTIRNDLASSRPGALSSARTGERFRFARYSSTPPSKRSGGIVWRPSRPLPARP